MCVLCFDGMAVVKEASVHGWGSGDVSGCQLGLGEEVNSCMVRNNWPMCEGALCDTSDPCKGGLPESVSQINQA